MRDEIVTNERMPLTLMELRFSWSTYFFLLSSADCRWKMCLALLCFSFSVYTWCQPRFDGITIAISNERGQQSVLYLIHSAFVSQAMEVATLASGSLKKLAVSSQQLSREFNTKCSESSLMRDARWTIELDGAAGRVPQNCSIVFDWFHRFASHAWMGQ